MIGRKKAQLKDLPAKDSNGSDPSQDTVVRLDGPMLGQLLVQGEVLTSEQLEEALLQQGSSGKRLGTLLVELGLVNERQLAQAIATQTSLPLIDLRQQVPHPEAIAVLPEALARSYTAVPIKMEGKTLHIAVADPVSSDAIKALQNAVGAPIKLHVAPASDIRRTIDNSYRALAGIERHIEAFKAVETTRSVESAPLQAAVNADAPVVKIVNLLVTQGLRDRASDIHIEPQEGRLRIRFRIDGALHDVLSLPESMGSAVVSRIKVMAQMNIVDRQRPQDGQIEMDVEGKPLDIRVATAPTIFGEKTVMRLLDKSKPLFRLSDLGMAPDVHEIFSRTVRSPFGMVLCAGPTGSGKTTTLYATITEINDTERNVMTVEDPVEYVFPSINQIQIREQAGVTFAGGLRAILRQDPDIILVGEIRDVETARIAVQSALTGHFVMSSLHATDAVSALHRFLDMGIEPFLIASSVVGIVGQRLVRRICTHCRAPYHPNAEEMSFFTESGGKATTFFQGEGCNFCAQTGYQDRVGVYELLRITDDMKQLIVRNASHDRLMALAVKEGMRPLRGEAIRLVDEGVTTIAEVLRSIYML